jgi:hypothetical protein
MGHMKNLDIILRNGGQEAVDVVTRISRDINEMLPRWISVWEQSPELNTRVLVFVKCKPHEHPHTIGAFMFGGNWVLDESYEEATEPTHWMPLPQDPPR